MIQEPEQVFAAYLTTQGLKFTAPRRLILDTVFNLHEHFDIEQLYDIIHAISDEVSRATVYRTIPLLMQAGLIQRSVRCETRDKFEHILGHPKHMHWVCRICGSVFETELDTIQPLIDHQASAHGFRYADMSIVIQGVCADCQKDGHESV